jgi:uncharacterized protein YaaQ
MKLIITIVRDTDTDVVSHALTSAEFRVTSVASTGGFLRKGQTTLLIGVEDDKLEKALEIIRNSVTKPSDSDVRRTVIFVVNVAQYEHF